MKLYWKCIDTSVFGWAFNSKACKLARPLLAYAREIPVIVADAWFELAIIKLELSVVTI